MRALIAAVLLFVPSFVGAECYPSAPLGGESEKNVAALLCRSFRNMSATKVEVSSNRQGLLLKLYLDDLDIIEALGKPEVAKSSLTGYFDVLPDMWKHEGRPFPAAVYLAIWSNDPTDLKPRVIWTRKGPGSPLKTAKTDGLSVVK